MWETISIIWQYLIPLFVIIGFINALLSLKNRYKDRKALKSKESFDKRIVELQKQIEKIGRYKNLPINFLLDTVYNSINIIFVLIGILALLLMAFTEYLHSIGSPDPAFSIFLAITYIQIAFILLLFIPTRFLLDLRRTIWNFQHPNSLLDEITNLIEEGKKKGFFNIEHLTLLNTLLETDILDKPQKRSYKFLWRNLLNPIK